MIKKICMLISYCVICCTSIAFANPNYTSYSTFVQMYSRGVSTSPESFEFRPQVENLILYTDDQHPNRLNLISTNFNGKTLAENLTLIMGFSPAANPNASCTSTLYMPLVASKALQTIAFNGGKVMNVNLQVFSSISMMNRSKNNLSTDDVCSNYVLHAQLAPEKTTRGYDLKLLLEKKS